MAQKRKTKKPVILAMVGLVGSGKSAIAKELAKLIGAKVIESDRIRVELRKAGKSYEGVQKIAEDTVRKIIKQGGNVVLDADFVNPKKRADLRKQAKKLGAKLLFIRTYADPDIMIGRVTTARYRDNKEDFFGGASSIWHASEQSKGAAVKIREMWRRTPHHYRWENKEGGRWVLKKLPFALFSEIDATDTKHWKVEVKKLAKNLKGAKINL